VNLLAPWYVPVLAAGLTVPPLIVLYFLKLKRRQVPIASTLLWKRAVYDLQVNSPFQKLRNNLLLILQLLILLAAVLAISEPMWAGRRNADNAVVLMIDHSASMAADEGEGQTRLDVAKQEAHKVIDDMSTDQRAMLIAFADRARLLTSFTDDKDELRRQIDRTEQTDAPGRLRDAMQLAEAHSTPTGEGIGTDVQITMSRYIVLTDGRLPDARDIVVERGTLEIARTGKATENVGIVNLDVRRNYERPEQLSVLARVRNFGGRPANRDISLLVDGELKDVQTLGRLAPIAAENELGGIDLSGVPPEGNEATVSFELMLASAAYIEVRLSRKDAFATDDQAWAVVLAPRPITALLVSAGNRYLRDVVDAFSHGLLDDYEVWPPEQYEEAPEEELVKDGRCRFDVVIFDGHSTERLPPGNYLFFASVPLIDEVDIGDMVTREVFLDWDETHPILRHVAVEAITVFSWLDLKLPPQATTLIDGTKGPILALLNRERNQYLICAFGIFDADRTHLNTDWVFQEGIVVFMSNALRYLAGSSTIGQQPSVTPGKAFTVAVRPGTKSVTVRRPDGATEKVPVQPSGLVTYGQTDRIGLYSVSTGIAGGDTRAVNLLDENESFIAPNEDFRIAAGELKEGKGLDRVNRPLWPYLLGLLGVILLIEWVVYNKRVLI